MSSRLTSSNDKSILKHDEELEEGEKGILDELCPLNLFISVRKGETLEF